MAKNINLLAKQLGAKNNRPGGNARPAPSPNPQPADSSDAESDPYAEQLARTEELMRSQMEQTAAYNRQSLALQERQMELSRQQGERQEQLALLANTESQKQRPDTVQTNVAQIQRRQMLRKGLMSTYTRFNGKTKTGTVA